MAIFYLICIKVDILLGLMMQEAAKAKEAAKRAREAEVFILNPQGVATTHTVPKPFKLHETTNQVSTVVVVRYSLCLMQKSRRKANGQKVLASTVMDTMTSDY